MWQRNGVMEGYGERAVCLPGCLSDWLTRGTIRTSQGMSLKTHTFNIWSEVTTPYVAFDTDPIPAVDIQWIRHSLVSSLLHAGLPIYRDCRFGQTGCVKGAPWLNVRFSFREWRPKTRGSLLLTVCYLLADRQVADLSQAVDLCVYTCVQWCSSGHMQLCGVYLLIFLCI